MCRICDADMEISCRRDQLLPGKSAFSARNRVADAHPDSCGTAGEISSAQAGQIGGVGRAFRINGGQRPVVRMRVLVSSRTGPDSFACRQQILDGVQILGDCGKPIIGTVLNMTTPKTGKGSYYSYYGYGYGYGSYGSYGSDKKDKEE